MPVGLKTKQHASQSSGCSSKTRKDESGRRAKGLQIKSSREQEGSLPATDGVSCACLLMQGPACELERGTESERRVGKEGRKGRAIHHDASIQGKSISV